MKQSKLLAVALAVVTALFILTASIALPIVCRPFYFLHIGPLGLEEYTGLSRVQIVQAYNEMMDFCTGMTDEFSTGVLAWSPSGRDHFVDVRGLFLLDLWAAGITGALLLAWALIRRRVRLRPYRFRKRGPAFWGCVGLAGTFLTIGGLAALDFDRAFVLFHALFFPGKSNWLFDWQVDQIILILPQEFFRNCAVFILALIVIACTALILYDVGQSRRKETQK